jgi:hypothetical protein
MRLTIGILSIALLLTSAGSASAQSDAPGDKANATTPEKVLRTYRLSYTITESDGGKRLGVQHFTLTATGDQREARAKLGSKVPIVTGSTNSSSALTRNEVQYIDVGLSISSIVKEFATGIEVLSKFEQSNVAEDKSPVSGNDPVIRQATLENTALLTPDKPVVLGSLDVPGSSRHLDVEVVLEIVK